MQYEQKDTGYISSLWKEFQNRFPTLRFSCVDAQHQQYYVIVKQIRTIDGWETWTTSGQEYNLLLSAKEIYLTLVDQSLLDCSELALQPHWTGW